MGGGREHGGLVRPGADVERHALIAACVSREPKVVHEGRGGYVEIAGVRYVIEHVEAGRFVIHFPSGHRNAGRAADREALDALVASEPTKWSIEERSRRR